MVNHHLADGLDLLVETRGAQDGGVLHAAEDGVADGVGCAREPFPEAAETIDCVEGVVPLVYQTQHGPQLLSEFEDGIHRGEHSVSGAANEAHVVYAPLITCLGVLMLLNLAKSLNENPIRLRRAKSLRFLTTAINLEKSIRSKLRPFPKGVLIAD